MFTERGTLKTRFINVIYGFRFIEEDIERGSWNMSKAIIDITK